MKAVTIDDKGVEFVLLVREEPPPLPDDLAGSIEDLRAAQEQREGPKKFLDWLREEMAARKLVLMPTPEAYKLTRHLLRQHGFDRLKVLARHFLTHKADALYEETYDRAIILFAAAIPVIEAELKDYAA